MKGGDLHCSPTTLQEDIHILASVCQAHEHTEYNDNFLCNKTN